MNWHRSCCSILAEIIFKEDHSYGNRRINILLSEKHKKYQVLSEADCEKLLNACFDIFENTGMDIQDAEAVKLLTDAGAKAEDGVVKVPRELVIRCINSPEKKCCFMTVPAI